MIYLAGNSTRVAGGIRAVCPTIPYRNATAMVDWLCNTLGFQKQCILESENGEIQHAQLIFGESLILVVRVEDSKLERLVVHPDQVGGVETQACYLVVPDIEAHYAAACKSGAEIVSGVERGGLGDRGYVCRDPEGHIWMLGSDDPHEGRPAGGARRRGRRGGPGVSLLALTFAALMVTFATGAWVYADRLAELKADALRFTTRDESPRQGTEGDATSPAGALLQVRKAQESAERQFSQARAALETALNGEKEARSLLAQEMRARESLARRAMQAEELARQERTAREAVEQSARDAADQVGRGQFVKAATDRLAKEITEKWELERKSRVLAEQSTQRAIAELAQERSARAAAELAASELRNQLTALGSTPPGIVALREQFEAERRARERFERAAKDAQLQLTQEKYSRDATERALKQVQSRLEQTQDRLAAASCWVCPSGAPCARP
jgi:uncharacterized glyoxalase superfamily protein PhnB